MNFRDFENKQNNQENNDFEEVIKFSDFYELILKNKFLNLQNSFSFFCIIYIKN